MNGERTRRHLYQHLSALVGYLGLTAFFYPYAVRRIASHPMSDGADGASFLWSYWQIPHAVSNLQNPFSTDLLFHPVGAPLAFHTNTPIESLVIGALGGLIGTTLAVNLVMFAAVVASGLGTYLLALHERASPQAAFLAGAVFAFLPVRVLRMVAHHNLNHTWILPLGLLALLVLLERPSRRRALVLGGLVGIAVLTDLSLTLFLGLAIAVILLWRRRDALVRESRVCLGHAAVVAFVVALPLLLAMAASIARGELDALPGWGGADVLSSDLLSWVVPPQWNRIWGSRFTDLGAVVGGERLAYPGLVVLLLAGIGAWFAFRRRTHTVWVGIAAVFFVLSLGPFLKVNGRSGDWFQYLGARFSFPLPYFAFHFVPLLNGLRAPGRFAVVAALALAVLASLALTRMAADRPLLVWSLPAVALALIAAEFVSLPVAPHQSPAIPRPYGRIAADTTRRAVLEIPVQWRDGFMAVGDTRDHTIFLYYGTRHRHPLVNGMVARLPKRRLDELLATPVYRQVLALQHQPGMTDAATFTAADLRSVGIGFVVYHRDRPMPDVLAHVSTLGLPLIDDDGTVMVWEVPRA